MSEPDERFKNCRLNGNIRIEYNRWEYREAPTSDYDRFDTLTGQLYKYNECTYEVHRHTYYICESEYPIYDIITGEYIGFYHGQRFHKPTAIGMISRDTLTSPISL